MTINPEAAALWAAADLPTITEPDWPRGGTIDGRPLSDEEVTLLRSSTGADAKAGIDLLRAEVDFNETAATHAILYLLREHTDWRPGDSAGSLLERCPPEVQTEVCRLYALVLSCRRTLAGDGP